MGEIVYDIAVGAAILASEAVLLSHTIRELRKSPRSDTERTTQVKLCFFDAILLLAITPLFVLYAIRKDDVRSIWEIALASSATTFVTTAAITSRTIFVAVLWGSEYASVLFRRKLLPFLLMAVVIVTGTIGTATALTCSLSTHHMCFALSSIRYTIASVSVLFAALASFVLIFTINAKAKASKRDHFETLPRTSYVGNRAPSLSLLIHTNPEPWTRNIDLSNTDFAPASSPAEGADYGPRIVTGILGTTSDKPTASLGYHSAVASSANPYHIESINSRDALGSRMDLNNPISVSDEREDNHGERDEAPSRGSGSRLLSPTLSPQNTAVTTKQASKIQLIASLISIWIPTVLSTVSLLLKVPNFEAPLLLASFCAPATIIALQQLALLSLHSSADRRKDLTDPSQFNSQSPTQRDSTSSAVMVHSAPTTLHRRPHLRSHSFPLSFSSQNSYGGCVSRKSRHSLSSTKSVPYLKEHWVAGKVIGDRVVRPRSGFVRGLNLAFNPKPRLEVLPQSGGGWGECQDRESFFPAGMNEAIVEGLLERPSGSGQHFLNASRAGSSLSTHQGCSTDVILNMGDDTPGSPRNPHKIDPLEEHESLQSPTKRRTVLTTEEAISFSNTNTDSSTMEDFKAPNSSTSRLFSEIMDLVRGGGSGHARTSSQSSILRRTPPKGYANIEGNGTIIIHSDTSHSAAFEEQGLTRKGSTSSTLSFSSISSRLLGITRTPAEQGPLKKVRSRTFASAFGIELGLLNRKRGTPTSVIDSSPSSAGGCPSSLLDYSCSPSPASTRQVAVYDYTPSPPGQTEIERKRLHKRNKSRADSIIDMLEDTIEEIRESDEVYLPSNDTVVEDVTDGIVAAVEGKCEQEEGEGGEVDLADVTVNEVWERSFPDVEEEFGGMESVQVEAGLEDVMGFKMRLATAPFLDTVEEEGEEEGEQSPQKDPQLDKQTRGGRNLSDIMEGDEELDHQIESRTSLLLEQEAHRQRVGELLAEHETAFPHKTLSRIEEVTEVATGEQMSRLRTESGASGSRSEKWSTKSSTGSIHLGLPLSMACQQDSSFDQRAEKEIEGEVKALAFVTPRSRRRVKAAASRRTFSQPSPTKPTEDSPVDPSPRSTNLRLDQLGMNHGIWTRSPVKPELDQSTISSTSTETSIETRKVRLRRGLTFSKRLMRMDHAASPKREVRNHLAKSPNAGMEKRLSHKPLRKPRKSRIKNVAVMIARHTFEVVDEDDSLVRRVGASTTTTTNTVIVSDSK